MPQKILVTGACGWLGRTIVEAHGGRLDVDIETPGETTFWFQLPLHEEIARV